MPFHPQAQAFLDALAEQEAPSWEEMRPEEAREIFSGLTDLFGPAPEIASIEERQVMGVSIRIFRPHGEGPFPGIVYFHGGGWVLGNLDTHDSLCRRLASVACAIVIAVDYSLSPEARFPTALNECFAVTQHVHENAPDFALDPARIVVAGDSAGGNLAAAVSLKALQANAEFVQQQVLIYPVLDARCDSESFESFKTDHGLKKSTMQWFWEQYLGEEQSGTVALASPLLAADLSGLPPTHVITAEFDVLRDEGVAFAKRLEDAKVPTTFRQYDGLLHGFIHFAGVFDSGIAAVEDIAQVIHSKFP